MTSISTNDVGDFKVVVAEQYDHDGWLLCDGRAVNIADHPELYALVGNAFLQGQEPRLRASDSNWQQPANTFMIPDMRGRLLGGVGEGGMDGRRCDACQAHRRALWHREFHHLRGHCDQEPAAKHSRRHQWPVCEVLNK